jgi:hypothetical protein
MLQARNHTVAVAAAVEAHVRAAGSAELDCVADRVLTARTVEEALGIPCTRAGERRDIQNPNSAGPNV